MKESEALRIVDLLVTSVQKFRSTIAETGYDDEAKELFAYLYGEHSFLKVLLKISDRGTLTTLDFYNLLVMADLHPELGVMFVGTTGKQLPEIKSQLTHREWEDEVEA